MSNKKIIGTLFLALSIIGGAYSIITYANDTSQLFGYTYTAPFTSHEVIVISIAAVSLIMLISGVSCLIGNDNSRNNMISSAPSTTINSKPNQENNISKLRHLKALLDEGLISQDEYDEQKKKLLDL